jgi:HAE1 family hydrophobic/amphiphilic exporter-1
MASFGVTMAFAVGVSLLVSFTLTPMMTSRWLRQRDMAVSSKGGRLYQAMEGGYLALLRWSLRHRWIVVLLLVAVIYSIVPLGKIANKNFLPNDDESQFEVFVRTPEGTSLTATRDVLRSIAARIRAFPEVQTTLLTLGDDQQRSRNYGAVYVRLVPVSERPATQHGVMDRVRREVLPLYERLHLRPQVSEVQAIGGGGTEAEIMLFLGGRDLDRLKEYSDVLTARLAEVPGVVDIDTNFLVGKPELGVRVDRARAADLGVRVEDLATTLQVLVGGQEVTDYYEGGEQYEVHVRAGSEYRRDVAGIAQVEVPSRAVTAGSMARSRVRLEDVVTLEEGSGPSQINRISRQRQILILANMQPGFSSQTALDALTEVADGLRMPPEYSYGFVGRSREQGKAAVQFGLAFLLSIIFMYLILAAQFESWIHPVTILLSLPLTIPFALLSIVVLDQSINIFSALGIVVLFGIVKKNSILQVDHMNALLATEMPREEAILEANRDRLRPILMTTFAFVAGMLPLVFSTGTGAGTNRAIGTVIAGGQTLSLLLSLIATPVVYSIFDDWRKARIFGFLRGKGAAGTEEEEQEAAGG